VPGIGGDKGKGKGRGGSSACMDGGEEDRPWGQATLTGTGKAPDNGSHKNTCRTPACAHTHVHAQPSPLGDSRRAAHSRPCPSRSGRAGAGSPLRCGRRTPERMPGPPRCMRRAPGWPGRAHPTKALALHGGGRGEGGNDRGNRGGWKQGQRVTGPRWGMGGVGGQQSWLSTRQAAKKDIHRQVTRDRHTHKTHTKCERDVLGHRTCDEAVERGAACKLIPISTAHRDVKGRGQRRTPTPTTHPSIQIPAVTRNPLPLCPRTGIPLVHMRTRVPAASTPCPLSAAWRAQIEGPHQTHHCPLAPCPGLALRRT
jgi:hypothetical protein